MHVVYQTLVSFFFSTLSYCAVAPPPLNTVYQFPQSTAGKSWLGNIAVRPSGEVLLTTVDGGKIYELDPASLNPIPQIIASIQGTNATTGITETSPDVFQVAAAATAPTGKATGQQKSSATFTIWRLDFTSAVPTVSLTANTTSDVKLINGLTTWNDSTIFGSDSTTGTIWGFDVTTGVQSLVWHDPILAPTGNGSKLGVNGLKVAKEADCIRLYFTNTARGILARIEVGPEDGLPLPNATAEVVATTPGSGMGFGFDDFALEMMDGDVKAAYMADSRGNTVSRFDFATQKLGSEAVVVAGNVNTTQIAEPEALAFGRTECDRFKLYTCTTGGVENRPKSQLVGGQILQLDTRDI